ncbi:Colicin V secretion protein CvaA [Fuerstiella marisgermanici]|uniref:Colicin V secretion protein CvaA n=1 Tax=Fuerstiella marisgermanici TaxID=1891926 RepID=A0A1P8WLZ2_9PLAN|nr:Colicin V secretion protein CvaA [Fuerstiella marisgermanici]
MRKDQVKTAINIVVSLIVLVAGFVGLRIFGQKPEVPTQDAKAEDTGVPVETAKVSAWNRPFNMTIDGEASTYRIVTVGSEVEGRIVKKAEAARSGTYIRKGDLLFQIDSEKYQLEIDRLRAQLQQADEEISAVAVDLENTASLISLAEEDLKLQNNQMERMRILLAKRTANETEVEAAMKQELVARNALQSLKNQKKSLQQRAKTEAADKALVQAELDRAELDLKRCTVTSTLEGRIVDDIVEEGDHIQSGDDLVHISDGSRMEIKCQLRGEELAWVWTQAVAPDKNANPALADPLNLPPVPCEVAFEFEGVETIWDGYIARLEGTGIDRDTRTFPCRVLVEEPHKSRINDSGGGRPVVSPPTLLSGMYVNVRIPIQSISPLLKLPLEAVRPGGQIWVDRGGKLDVVEVSLAHSEGDMALVRQSGSGLSDGDRVIVSPLVSVRDGMKVTSTTQEAAE